VRSHFLSGNDPIEGYIQLPGRLFSIRQCVRGAARIATGPAGKDVIEKRVSTDTCSVFLSMRFDVMAAMPRKFGHLDAALSASRGIRARHSRCPCPASVFCEQRRSWPTQRPSGLALISLHLR
jgi:hypothetical protein